MRGKTLKTKACSMYLKQSKTTPQRDTSGHSLDGLNFISLTRLIGANVKQPTLTFIAGEDIKWYNNDTAWLPLYEILHRKSNL